MKLCSWVFILLIFILHPYIYAQTQDTTLSDTSTVLTDSMMVSDPTLQTIDPPQVIDSIATLQDSISIEEPTETEEEETLPEIEETVIDTAQAIIAHLDSAIVALERDSIDKAFYQLSMVGKYEPQHPDAEFYYGNGYFLRAQNNSAKYGEYLDSAFKHLDKAILLDTAYYSAYYLKGLLHYNLGENENETYIELRPEKRLLKNFSEAWKTWKQLKKLNPDYDYESAYPALIYEMALAFDIESNIGDVYTIEQYLLIARELMREASDFGYDAATYWLNEHAEFFETENTEEEALPTEENKED